jgi:hypothetical protein
MPIQRGVFVLSRSLDLFLPGQRHPWIKGHVHACHALSPQRLTANGRPERAGA